MPAGARKEWLFPQETQRAHPTPAAAAGTSLSAHLTRPPPLPAIEGLWAHDALRLATVQHALGDAEKEKLRPSLVKSGKQKGGQALSQRVDEQMGQVLCAGAELKHRQKRA